MNGKSWRVVIGPGWSSTRTESSALSEINAPVDDLMTLLIRAVGSGLDKPGCLTTHERLRTLALLRVLQSDVADRALPLHDLQTVLQEGIVH
jgi:hypothetical protein